MIRSTQRHLAAVSASGRRRHLPVDRAPDSWRNSTTTRGFIVSDGTSIIAQLDYMLKFTAYNGIYHGAFQCVSLYDLYSSCLLSNIFIYGIEDSLYLSVFASEHNGNSGSATPA